MNQIRRNLRNIYTGFRRVSAKWRVLPDFIILGAQKSGTSSLWYYISQHPGIRMSIRKETHFFDFNYHQDPAWYRAYFPLQYKVKPGLVVGESTPYYLCHPHVAERIYQVLPKVKLIAVLRNPTARALSHYYHEVKKGTENLSLMEALAAEDERTQSEWEKMNLDPSYASAIHRAFSYKSRGKYLMHLSRFWEYFDKNQLLIVQSEKLFQDTAGSLAEIFQFLGLEDSCRIKDISVRNIGSYPKHVPTDVFDYLDSYFKEYNLALYKEINQEFNW